MNKQIFEGNTQLEVDWIWLQSAIDIVKTVMFSKTPEEEIQWILQEGTMSSKFLNLEKTRQMNNNNLESVIDDQGQHKSTEYVLSAIHNFYNTLYSNCDSKSE